MVSPVSMVSVPETAKLPDTVTVPLPPDTCRLVKETVPGVSVCAPVPFRLTVPVPVSVPLIVKSPDTLTVFAPAFKLAPVSILSDARFAVAAESTGWLVVGRIMTSAPAPGTVPRFQLAAVTHAVLVVPHQIWAVVFVTVTTFVSWTG